MPMVSPVGLAIGAPSFGTMKVSLRSNFSMHHLGAAARAAREAYDVEQSNPEEHGPWFDDMLRLVPVSVVMAGAALEANVNEIVRDILEAGNLAGVEITKGQGQLLRDLKDERSGNPIEKYRTLAYLFDKDPETGNKVWQDARLLVKFRNYFMHFKPAWDHETDVHNGALVKALKERVPVAPGYRGEKEFLPYCFMTYGCAKWAIETVQAFSGHYAKSFPSRSLAGAHSLP